MTSDERGLLEAIAAAPADDTPRLVYADWLDDHGHPVRAEFIRLQCRIAQIETQPRHVVNLFAGLWQRQQEILDGHWNELLGPLAGVTAHPIDTIFHRGFLDELNVPVERFLPFAEAVDSLQPLPSVVRVTGTAADPRGFLSCPHLAGVTHVSLYAYRPPPGAIDVSLTEVAAAGTQLKRLRGIDAEHCRLSGLDLRMLYAVFPPTVEELDLSHNEITDEELVWLLDSPLPRQLKRLVLGGNPIGDQGAIELADRWPRNSPLEMLNLRFTPGIGRAGHEALLARFGGKVDLF